MKTRLCVLFGGESTEYEISLRSATSVISNLDKDKYELTLVGITKEGKWHLYDGDIDDIEKNNWYSEGLNKVLIDHSSKNSSLLIFKENEIEKRPIDVVFPVLHGKFGEDGTMQGLFEIAGIKYVGCGVLSSCVSMDKAYAKIVFKQAKINQANWLTVNHYERDNLDKIVDLAEKELGYPMFVKPSNAGSSIGIGKAKNKKELLLAINNAFLYDRRIIIEEFLKGHEVECAVIGGNGKVFASCVGEIIASNEFYDYEAKYAPDATSEIIIPADLKNDIQEKIKELAISAFLAVDGFGLSRVDFFVDDETGEIRINEINTMPGFTSISMYPKLLIHEKMTYSQVLDRLIELACNKN